MSKKRIGALGASAASAALVSSALFAPAAVAQEDQGPFPSPSAFAIQATGAVDIPRVSYVTGTDSTELIDVSLPENDPMIVAKVAPTESRPGYAHADIVYVKLGQGKTSLTLHGITATCDDGEVKSALASIEFQGETYPIGTSANTELVPAPLNEVIDITLNQQIPRDNGSTTVNAVKIELLSGAQELVPENTPLLSGLAGQTITLASATCSNVPGDDKPDDGGDKPDNGGDDGDNDNGGDDNGHKDNGGADDAEDDGTAPTPVPQPDHIAVTG